MNKENNEKNIQSWKPDQLNTYVALLHTPCLCLFQQCFYQHNLHRSVLSFFELLATEHCHAEKLLHWLADFPNEDLELEHQHEECIQGLLHLQTQLAGPCLYR